MAMVRKVALLGNSVISSSLASTLRCRPELEVIQLDTAVSDALASLWEAHPDAIILCELLSTPTDLIFLILREFPGIPVIRADVEGDRMDVLSGRHANLRTEDDLVGVLHSSWPSQAAWRPDGDVEESRIAWRILPQQHVVEDE